MKEEIFKRCMSTVYIREMFNSQRTDLGHQHGRRLRTPMWRFFMHDGTTLKRVCRGSGFSLQQNKKNTANQPGDDHQLE